MFLSRISEGDEHVSGSVLSVTLLSETFLRCPHVDCRVCVVVTWPAAAAQGSLGLVRWRQFSHEVRLRHRQGNPELKILFTIAMEKKKKELYHQKM